MTGSTVVLLTGLAGWTLGTAIGVYSVGNIDDETGSFKDTLTGTLGGVLLGAIVGGKRLTNEGKGSIILCASPPIFATCTFNLSRRYKSFDQSKTGFY